MHGAADKRPAHSGDIQPAHLGNSVKHILFTGLMQPKRISNHALLMGEGLIRQSPAPAAHLPHGSPGQYGQHGGTGGGVTDAHFTDAHDVHALCVGSFHRLHPGGHGIHSLLPGHGRLTGNIPGAPPHLAVYHPLRRRGVNAHVRHHHAVAEVVGHGGHTGFMPGHIDALLHRHALRRRADPLGHHAVVGGKHQHPAFFRPWRHRALNPRQGHGVVLQPPQAPRGLGQLRLPPPCPVHGVPVNGVGCGDALHQFLFRHIIRPLMRESNKSHNIPSYRPGREKYSPPSRYAGQTAGPG